MHETIAEQAPGTQGGASGGDCGWGSRNRPNRGTNHNGFVPGSITPLLGTFKYSIELYTFMVRKNEHMFEIKFLTPLEQELLRFLSLHPNTEFHLRDLAKITNRSISGSHTAIKHLEGSNLILSRFSGRNKYIQANQSNPSIRTFKVFMNTYEAYSSILPFSERIQKAILYGSCSKGEDTYGSDVDIFILSMDKDLRSELRDEINGRKVNYRIVNGSELLILRKSDPGYINEVEKGMILLEAGHGLQ